MTLSLFMIRAAEMQLEALAFEPMLLDRLGRTWRDRRGSGAASVDVLRLERSWHVLHGLLAGSAWDGPAPGRTLLAGGHEIGNAAGSGLPRLAGSQETADFAEYLSPLCPRRLGSRVDPRRVARTRFYAAAEGEPPSLAELRDGVEQDLPRLKAHVAAAASKGHGLLMFMM